MNVKQLKELLAELGPEHDERDVILEGCDCLGVCGGIDLTFSDEVLLTRDGPGPPTDKGTYY